jgi:hypothetical protein
MFIISGNTARSLRNDHTDAELLEAAYAWSYAEFAEITRELGRLRPAIADEC